MNDEMIPVRSEAVEWLKKHYPALCEKSGLCERIAGRLYTRTALAAQPAASAEPSDEEAAKFVDQYGMYYDQDASIAGAHARALLSRYGRGNVEHCSGDAQPYAYEYGRSNGDGTFSVVIERGQPRNPVKDWPVKPLYAAPVAAQKADDARDAERYRWLISSHWYVGPEPDGEFGGVPWEDHNATKGGVTQAIDAAIAQQGKGGVE